MSKGYFGMAPARPIYRHPGWSHDRMADAGERVKSHITDRVRTNIEELEDITDRVDPRYIVRRRANR